MRSLLIVSLGGVLLLAGCSHNKDSSGSDMGNMKMDSNSTTMPSSMAMPATMPAATVYTCPMHPQITSNMPGKCPICGMELVPKKS